MRTQSFSSTLMALVALAAACGQACVAQSWAADMKGDDARLVRPVTARMGRTTVGELVDLLSDQADIEITCSDRDRSGDPSLVVDICDAQAWQVMDALRSLVSYSGAMWAWERSVTGTAYRYRLRRPLPAQNLAASVRAWAQTQFEQSLDLLIAAADASPEARRAGAQSILGALWREPGQDHDTILADDRCWDGFRCIAEALPAGERGAGLRGGVSKRVLVRDLRPAAREFVMREWRMADAHTRRGPNGPIEKVPPPTYVTLRTNDGSNGDPTPALLLGLEGLGEFAWSGAPPLDRAACRHLGASWNHDGDSTTSPILGRECRRTDAEVSACDPTAAYRLRQTAEWSNTNLMVRLPELGCSISETPDGRRIGAYLEALRGSLPTLQWKVRDGIVLVTDHRWLWFDGTELPYSTVQALRSARADSLEPVDLGQVAPAVRSLTTQQARELDHRYPLANWLHGLRAVTEAVGAAPAALRELQSTAGSRIPVGLARDLLRRPASTAGGATASARIAIELDRREPQARTARCEVRVGSAPWVAVAEFRCPVKAAAPKRPQD